MKTRIDLWQRWIDLTLADNYHLLYRFQTADLLASGLPGGLIVENVCKMRHNTKAVLLEEGSDLPCLFVLCWGIATLSC